MLKTPQDSHFTIKELDISIPLLLTRARILLQFLDSYISIADTPVNCFVDYSHAAAARFFHNAIAMLQESAWKQFIGVCHIP